MTHRLGLIALTVFSAAVAGCSSGLKVGQGNYRGPAIGVDSSGEWHVLVASPPSPGWRVTLDGQRDTADGTNLFVSLRRPSPAATYPQVVVEQRVLTAVRSNRPVDVLARTLPFAGDEDQPYFAVPD